MRHYITLFVLLALVFSNSAFSQGSPNYKGGFKIKFDDSDNKYVRILTWVQTQANFSDSRPDDQADVSFQLRRARLLVYGQITKDFLILTHIGINSLNAQNMDPLGADGAPQVFMHDAWAQYDISDQITVGGGLHYWNGLSRLNSQSTLNLMTLDNNRSSWATLGLTDQFARHVGVFAKGNFGKLQYNVAINEAIVNGLDTNPLSDTNAVYQGANILGTAEAGKTYTGYFAYNFLNLESNFLPYKVGTYLGTERIFNVGAGFFHHPNGAIILKENQSVGENVTLFAADLFYDAPIGENGASLTSYAVFQSNDYGTNYFLGPYSSGEMLYGHFGYLLSSTKSTTRFQPYVSYNYTFIDASDQDRTSLGLGINAYLNGHNSKLTLEYKSESFGTINQNTLSLQAMIYL
ncbi:hypothetical protein P700755_003356 [Psychroflexus torquis ATCC 700755]|uniref:Short chain amide porin n=1 Tax=Psychroflexus torquis (strain ATCC 700755 / CIP 106069 / ACAM 623) TaxID=313595 RepID=K4IHK4_PSYTT|nr:hypothetical protein [Psychroflexus torquis]AFU69997.1 hypothetical protein P700755_003356 [Psychroflexus torquis ATCC 700755]